VPDYTVPSVLLRTEVILAAWFNGPAKIVIGDEQNCDLLQARFRFCRQYIQSRNEETSSAWIRLSFVDRRGSTADSARIGCFTRAPGSIAGSA
jgi:hypothetical protein